MCVGVGVGVGVGGHWHCPHLIFIHSGKSAVAVDSCPSLLQRMSDIVEGPIALFQRLACTNVLSTLVIGTLIIDYQRPITGLHN